MPGPSTDVRNLRPDISGVLQPYNEMTVSGGFIADRVAPATEVADTVGQYAKVTGANALPNVDTKRGKDGRYNQITWEWGTGTYTCYEHGLIEVVDRRDAKRYGRWFDAEVAAARRVRAALARAREIRIAALLFNATTFVPASSITNEWDDFSLADPIADVTAAKKRCIARGIEPNALIINRLVYENVRACDSVLDRIASSGAGMPTMASMVGVAQLQAVFDLPHILVGGGQKNSADEGLAASLTPIWSNEYAMVCRIAENENIEDPCIMRTFHYGEDGSQIGGVAETYYSEDRRADVARIRMDVAEEIIATQAGELLDNITT